MNVALTLSSPSTKSLKLPMRLDLKLVEDCEDVLTVYVDAPKVLTVAGYLTFFIHLDYHLKLLTIVKILDLENSTVSFNVLQKEDRILVLSLVSVWNIPNSKSM